jgi:hypothetical protein
MLARLGKETLMPACLLSELLFTICRSSNWATCEKEASAHNNPSRKEAKGKAISEEVEEAVDVSGQAYRREFEDGV